MEKQINNPWYYLLNGVLIKEIKPCRVGDHVHLHNWNGCYRVYDVDLYGFYIMKNRRYIKVTWDQFRCLQGEGNSPEKKEKQELRNLLMCSITATAHLSSIKEQLESRIKELKGRF